MAKNPQNLTICQKKDLNVAKSKIKNYLNIRFPIALKRGWRLVLEKSFKKNKNTEVEIETKNRPNC